MRVLFALVAWGQAYVRDFLDVSLPTLMAEGNLADNDAIEGSHLLILTTQADVSAFEADPLLGALKRTVPIEYLDIRHLRSRDKYRFASRCQMEALHRSEDFDAVILLYPDMIWCRGGVRFAVERLKDGALGVMTPAPAVLPEPTLSALRADVGAANVISVAPGKLAQIALRHHHPMWDAFDWDGGAFGDFPSCLRWNVGEEGWLVHCFHLHPLALRVQRDNPRFLANFATSLDGEYVARLFDGTHDLAFPTDTDEFAMVTLREPQMGPFPLPGSRPSVASVARWAEANAFLLHRAFVGVPFRWHNGPLNEDMWRAAEQRARGILGEVKDRLHTPDSVVRSEDPEAYLARCNRRHSDAFLSKPTIELPPSYARQPRLRLAAALFTNLARRTLMRTKRLIGHGALSRWLRQQPTAIAAWTRARRTLAPKSAIYGAASTKSLIRCMMAARQR
jgi:hypothetical protein